MVESGLRAAGCRTGLFTSPHLVEPTERIQVEGVAVSAAEFVWAFEEVHRVAGELHAAGQIDAHPSYFETVTAMGLLLFRRRRTDFVVLETGMGGRLDATNVVTPVLSVITPIDFDHEKFLGETIPQIAFEKAGIIKPGIPLVVSIQRPEAREVLEAKARESSSRLIDAAKWSLEDIQVGAYGSSFRARRDDATLGIDCPLLGAHQVENALTAITALEFLGLSAENIQAGIRKVQWPGRLELVRKRPDVFLDGAHNPAGAEALAKYIRQFHAGRKIWMVFAAMRDKDLHRIGGHLFPLASELIFTMPEQYRAFTGEELREKTGEHRAFIAKDAKEAVARVAQADPSDAVFFTGSLYLVGEARPLLRSQTGFGT
jgi:dihydrofolate synthase / folylpolyglutamate synthase